MKTSMRLSLSLLVGIMMVACNLQPEQSAASQETISEASIPDSLPNADTAAHQPEGEAVVESAGSDAPPSLADSPSGDQTISQTPETMPSSFESPSVSGLSDGQSADADTPISTAAVPILTYTVNSTNDVDDATCDVTHCSLREAFNAANLSAGLDQISFDIIGAAPYTIQPTSALPTITDPIIIDGRTEPDFVGTPIIIIDGLNADDGVTNVDGLTIIAGSSEVYALVIYGYDNGQAAIRLETGGNNIIASNYINLSQDGTTRMLGWDGIHIVNSPGNLIGSSTLADRNVINAEATGILIEGAGSDTNIIQGNIIGATPDGLSVPLPLVPTGSALDDRIQIAVHITNAAPNTLIGGTNPGEGNLLSGIITGIGMIGGSTGTTLIQGNLIGDINITGLAQLTQLPNGEQAQGGIFLSEGVSNVQIGGSASGAGNLITLVNNGILGYAGGNLTTTISSITIQGNLFGSDITGTIPLVGSTQMGVGIVFQDKTTNIQIGGVNPGEGNLFNGTVVAVGFGPGGTPAEENTGNTISGNIYLATTQAIDLVEDVEGFTPNDVDDVDIGVNGLQNFPDLSYTTPGSINIGGTLDSAADSTYRLEFYTSATCTAPASTAETFLGYLDVLTDANGDATFVANFPDVIPVGNFVLATATAPDGSTSEFSPCLEVIAAQTFVVNTITDTDDGTCDVTHCSLHEAINAANASPTKDTINFDIAGAGPHTITVTSVLPIITQPVIIDGTSEPDYVDAPVVGFIAVGDPVAPTAFTPICSGYENSGWMSRPAFLNIQGGDSVVKGLSFSQLDDIFDMIILLEDGGNNLVQGNYFDFEGGGSLLNQRIGIYIVNSPDNQIGGAGINEGNVIVNSISAISLIGCESAGNKIQGNILGLDPTGTILMVNKVGVSIVDGASNNLIGGSAVGEGNTFQSREISILMLATHGGLVANNLIQGNLIGALPHAPNLNLDEPTGIYFIANVLDNLIGGTNPGEANIIRNNAIGILLDGNPNGMPTGNRINGNNIYNNPVGGILMVEIGYYPASPPNFNDLGDIDTGPNNYQNYPVITSVVDSGATRDIVGTFNSVASTDYRIEYFANSVCNPIGYGEGETYLGFIDVITDGSGNADISTSFADAIPAGYFITTTATDPAGNTSEFSACEVVQPTPQTFVVNTILDNNDGTCDVTHCSLREAINAANLYANKDTINFDIAGAGPHTITVTSILPAITVPVIIDGASEPDYVDKPIVEIDGNNLNSSEPLLRLQTWDSTIKGLSIYEKIASQQKLIGIEGGGNHTIQGNYINIDAAGNPGDSSHGITITNSINNLIGGSGANEGNVISRVWLGIRIDGNGSQGNIIQGNLFGLDPTGTIYVKNAFSILVEGGSSNTQIGGSGAGEGNIFSPTATSIMIGSSNGNIIQGNIIGAFFVAFPAEDTPIGVLIGENGHDNLVGGTNPDEGNIIRYHRIGVVVGPEDTVTGNSINGNSIYDNQDMGIDLSVLNDPLSTQTPNDPDDADVGANNLQNYPVITSTDATSDTLIGTLNSEANKTYQIDFYDNASCGADSYGQGETYIGSATVSTDGSGNANFSEVFAGKVIGGTYITATATDPDGNTSEFSACAGVSNTSPFTDCASVNVISETECNALNDLYTSTTGASWTTNTDWFATNSPCTWFGVLCSDGEVIALNIGGNNLNGPLLPSIGDLSGLIILDLGGNKLSGGIPVGLGSLANLTTLDLGANALIGEIPAALTGLTSLTTADFGKNALFASNGGLLTLLGTVDSDWADTQTIAPIGVTVETTDYSKVTVTWTSVDYTAPGGYYEVSIGTAPGGPYTIAGTTASLADTNLLITGLDVNTTYYVVVRTYTQASGEQQNNLWSSYSVEATGQTGALISPPGSVRIDSVTASLDGNGPYTITLTIEGQYPSGCGGRMTFDQQVDGTSVYIDMVQMERSGGKTCGGSAKPFSLNVILDGVYSGATYTIYINGQTIDVIVP